MNDAPASGAEDDAPGAGVPTSPLLWTRERQEIREFLQDKAHPLADLYEAAVRMVYEEMLPGRLRFVSHAARDICNRLAEYLGGARDAERLEYHERLDELAIAYEEAGFEFGAQSATSSDTEATSTATIAIPIHLHRKMEEFILAHRQASNRNDEKTTRLFTMLAPDAAGQMGTLAPALDQWNRLRRWFNGSAHDAGPDVPIERIRQREGQLPEKFSQFEAILGSLVGGFYRTLRDLDDILDQANRARD